MPTQRELVLQHLRQGEPITQFQALRDYGIQRLAARVHELRQDGHPVEDRTVEVRRAHGGTARVSEYYLSGAEEVEPQRFGDLPIGARFESGGLPWRKQTAFAAHCLDKGRDGGREHTFPADAPVQPIRDGK